MSNYSAGPEHDPNAPWNEVDYENDCMFCGKPTNNKFYCSKECQKADLKDLYFFVHLLCNTKYNG